MEEEPLLRTSVISFFVLFFFYFFAARLSSRRRKTIHVDNNGNTRLYGRITRMREIVLYNVVKINSRHEMTVTMHEHVTEVISSNSDLTWNNKI